jgi:hypothetical protein
LHLIAEDRGRLLGRDRALIRPGRGDRVEDIHHSNDLRDQRDGRALQSIRIPGPVQALMMVPDDRSDRL